MKHPIFLLLKKMFYKGDISSMRSRILFDICEPLASFSVFSFSILCWFHSNVGQKFFFSFPFIADLTDVRDKSFFFVSIYCWFDWRQGEKLFFSFPFIADLIAMRPKSFFIRFFLLLISATSGHACFT